jgi:iron complex outermembrane receptor protein
MPIRESWIATFRADGYWAGNSYARIFNEEPYDKIRHRTNLNLAAILSNEDDGWQIMGYVKNVFDDDFITGAFLNSDDTALTTNVFVNEPRLFGVRVTKNW